jgi:hypothetical protein
MSIRCGVSLDVCVVCTVGIFTVVPLHCCASSVLLKARKGSPTLPSTWFVDVYVPCEFASHKLNYFCIRTRLFVSPFDGYLILMVCLL